MIRNDKLHLVIDKTNSHPSYSIYEFTPSITRLFYKNYEKQTLQRYIRFLLEFVKGYKVYYLVVNKHIVAYSVISRGGGRYSFAKPEDIVVGPYFVLEKYRGNHYSELLVSELLKYKGIRYQYAYDWVKKTNLPSLRCSDKVGFVKIATMDLKKPFRTLQIRKDYLGEYYLLRFKRRDEK